MTFIYLKVDQVDFLLHQNAIIKNPKTVQSQNRLSTDKLYKWICNLFKYYSRFWYITDKLPIFPTVIKFYWKYKLNGKLLEK